MKKYKYILSDADNTLFDFDLAEHEALSETMKKFGVCLSETEHAAYHEINDGLWKKLERGEITREKLKIVRFSEFSDFLGRGIEASPEELAQEYVKNLALQSQLVPGALEFCRNTSAKYPLYLITNGITHVQRSRLAGSPIADYFTRRIHFGRDGMCQAGCYVFQKGSGVNRRCGPFVISCNWRFSLIRHTGSREFRM